MGRQEWTCGGGSALSVNKQHPWCPAGAGRGLPILLQEALVLGFGLDASSGCSHLPVNGHHLVLHQAANLQVFPQDLLPAPDGTPGQQGLRLGKAGELEAPGTGFRLQPCG